MLLTRVFNMRLLTRAVNNLSKTPWEFYTTPYRARRDVRVGFGREREDRVVKLQVEWAPKLPSMGLLPPPWPAVLSERAYISLYYPFFCSLCSKCVPLLPSVYTPHPMYPALSPCDHLRHARLSSFSFLLGIIFTCATHI
jgi:hypothetical protein